MAASLCARVTLVSAVPPSYPPAVFDGIDLRRQPAVAACGYENRYDAGGARTQHLFNPGAALTVPEGVITATTAAVIVAPAYHEIAAIGTIQAPVLAVALQGILRLADANGAIRPRPQPFTHAAPFARPGTLVFFSDEDTLDPPALARACAANGASVFLTHGAGGVSLYEGGREWRVASLPADSHDPTGAGDCFATAFTVRFAETGDRADALRWALAAGALATEAVGIAGIPSRAAIEQLARKEAA